MLRHLKCPPGPRECLTKEEVVVGGVEVEEEGEEEGVEGEVEEVTLRVEWGAIKLMGFMSGTKVKAATKEEVVDREVEVAGIREEVEGFKVLAGLVEMIIEVIVEGVDKDIEVVVVAMVEMVTVEVDKDMGEVDKDMEDKDMGEVEDKDMGEEEGKDTEEVVKVEEAMEVVEGATAEEGDEGGIDSSDIDICVILLSLQTLLCVQHIFKQSLFQRILFH